MGVDPFPGWRDGRPHCTMVAHSWVNLSYQWFGAFREAGGRGAGEPPGPRPPSPAEAKRGFRRRPPGGFFPTAGTGSDRQVQVPAGGAGTWGGPALGRGLGLARRFGRHRLGPAGHGQVLAGRIGRRQGRGHHPLGLGPGGLRIARDAPGVEVHLAAHRVGSAVGGPAGRSRKPRPGPAPRLRPGGPLRGPSPGHPGSSAWPPPRPWRAAGRRRPYRRPPRRSRQPAPTAAGPGPDGPHRRRWKNLHGAFSIGRIPARLDHGPALPAAGRYATPAMFHVEQPPRRAVAAA